MNKYKGVKINGKKYDEHRVVFTKHIGRELTKDEVVHHIDGDKSNNDINNLMLFPTKSSHTKFHYQNGDYDKLKERRGSHKKKLIEGKLMCNYCKKYKEKHKFVTHKDAHLGVLGICRDCNKERRKKYNNQNGIQMSALQERNGSL